eukprot:365069-Chlamydomonas_euryale.AAC.3
MHARATACVHTSMFACTHAFAHERDVARQLQTCVCLLIGAAIAAAVAAAAAAARASVAQHAYHHVAPLRAATYGRHVGTHRPQEGPHCRTRRRGRRGRHAVRPPAQIPSRAARACRGLLLTPVARAGSQRRPCRRRDPAGAAAAAVADDSRTRSTVRASHC